MRITSVAAVLGGAVLLLPVGSFVASPIVPVALRGILALLWLTAALRPQAAIAALAVLAPFGSLLIALLDAPPVQYTEALVLATLSGALLSSALDRRHDRRAPSPSMVPAALVFGAVVLCSLAVFLAISQIGLGVRWYFVRNVATLLVRDYLVSPPGQWASITAAARLLEGVLLILVVIRRGAAGGDRFERIITAFGCAAAAASIVSLMQLATMIGDAGSWREVVPQVLTARLGFVADANAAGSFFAAATFVTLALAVRFNAPAWIRLVWGVTAAAAVAALLLSGSRSALVAVMAVVVAAGLWVGAASGRRLPRWWLAAAGGVALLLAIAVGFDPRAVARRSLIQTLDERAAFIMTGLGMMQKAPLFGMGIGRYFETSGGFMPQSIYWFHLRENAHNNFLQIGGELGLAGLAAFIWLLATATIRGVRGLRSNPRDRLLAGSFAALASFVVTWLAGHPLLTPEVAFPFWILAGAAVGRADTNRPPAVEMPASPVIGRFDWNAVVVSAAILVLVATVPIRARLDAASLNLAEQSFGFYDWEGERPGRFRWTSPTATLFVPAHAYEVELPICAAWSDKRAGTTVVTIRVDGQIQQKLGLTNGNWLTVQLRLPASVSGDRYRRLDIVTDPPWTPAAVLGTRDSRVLGVQVGEVTVR